MATERRRGRVHDAEAAREAILDAAEEVFAQHGFDGARIDAIAATAGYNKSLIFHYFEDKFGLYTAVVKRIKKLGEDEVRTVLYAFTDNAGGCTRLTHDVETFRAFLETSVKVTFACFHGHPRFLRILTWEAAEGWQTFLAIVTEFDEEGRQSLTAIVTEARTNGLIHSDINTALFFALTLGLSQTYLSSLPRYQVIFNDDKLATSEALLRAREQIAAFVVHGMMNDILGSREDAGAHNREGHSYESETTKS